jgi:ribosomal protein L24
MTEPLKRGDRVEILRGTWKGTTGRVVEVIPAGFGIKTERVVVRVIPSEAWKEAHPFDADPVAQSLAVSSVRKLAEAPAVVPQDSQDDDLIHFVNEAQMAACGVDVARTPYTFGSEQAGEVTCEACKPHAFLAETLPAHAAAQREVHLMNDDLLDACGTAERGQWLSVTPVLPDVTCAACRDIARLSQLPWSTGYPLVTNKPGPF